MPQNFPARGGNGWLLRRAPAAPAASVPDQIEQLAHLRDQGHITPEEYEQKKSELLGRM